MKRLVLAIAAAGLLGAGSFAQACSLTAWSSTTGTPTVGGPEASEPDVDRFSGLCAAEFNAAESVTDLSPADEPTIIIRFYYKVEGSGNADILIGYMDEGGATPVFTVSTDGASVTVTPNDGGTAATASADAGLWNLVEFFWTQGGAINLWVNSDAALGDPADASGSSGSGTSTISSVEFGLPNGLGGFTAMQGDDYESRRMQAVGGVCNCDANDDGTINVGDASLVVAERLGQNEANGAPDCNRDGTINVGDASGIVAIRLGPTAGACP